MNNEIYYKELENRLEKIMQSIEACKCVVSNIMEQTLSRDNLFYVAAFNRCIQLLDGIAILLQQRNLSCVGAILRLQMDNCMRTYAAFIAKDKHAVISCVIYGGKISDQIDSEGNKMTDAYLKKRINEFDDSFSKVYDYSSGYIHFSDSAFYQTVVDCNDREIELHIGKELHEKFNPTLLQVADAFIGFVKLHCSMMQSVIKSK